MEPQSPLAPGNPLLPALLDAVNLFNDLKIPYALIGGIAAMIYGRARFTDDIDFAVAAGHELTLAANPEIMTAHHFDPSCTWKLYHSSGVEIDIWKDTHTDAIARRGTEIQFASTTIRVVNLHDLIAMKLRAGRLQDDYDIGEIVCALTIDEALLQPLLTSEEFQSFKQIQSRAQRQP